MNLAQSLHQIETLIFSGALKESKEKLTQVQTSETWMNRKKQHLLAKIEFAQGDYVSATKILEQTISDFGSHVLLTADLLLCYFNTHQHLAWMNLVDHVHATLLKQHLVIENETWVRAAITVAGFLEEKGEIAPALDLLRSALELPGVGAIWRERTQAHLTRVLTYFGMSTELRKNYQLLISPNSDSKQILINWERTHAQVLAEYCLLDKIQFSNRWVEFSRTHKDFPEIVRWVLYDLLEVSILTGKDFPLNADVFQSYPPHASYETCLLQLMSQDLPRINDELIESLTPFCKIKILICLARTNPEVQQTVDLWLLSISPRSQKYLTEAFRHLAKWQPSRDLFLLGGSIVRIDKVEVDLRRKPISWQILQLFSKKNHYSHNELATALWGSELEGTKDRLRMNILRLNKLLQMHLGESSLLTIHSAGVSLKAGHSIHNNSNH